MHFLLLLQNKKSGKQEIYKEKHDPSWKINIFSGALPLFQLG